MTALPENFTVRRMVTERGDCLELRVIDGAPRRFVNGHIVTKGGDGAEHLKRSS